MHGERGISVLYDFYRQERYGGAEMIRFLDLVADVLLSWLPPRRPRTSCATICPPPTLTTDGGRFLICGVRARYWVVRHPRCACAL